MAEMRRNRAQLLLIAGLVLAVLFVALALLVNTAIYTENVATRGGEVDSDALAYRGAVVSTVGGLVDAENADPDSDRSVVETDGVPTLSEELDGQFARRGATTNVGFINRTDGFLILQNESRNFTDRDGNPSYTLAEVDSTRDYVFTVDPQNTSSTDEFSAVLNDTASPDNETRYNISADVDDVTVTFEVVNGTGVVRTETCSISHNDAPVSVDLTKQVLETAEETVRCEEFAWPETYDTIEHRNGDKANGTYRVTVDAGDEDLVDIETLEYLTDTLGLTDPDGPFALKAVYDVWVDLRYDSNQISYETTVRIAPGEPDA
jgi:hypothetical protein